MRSRFTKWNESASNCFYLYLDTRELFLLYRRAYISLLIIEILENGKCCVLNDLFITSYIQINWSALNSFFCYLTSSPVITKIIHIKEKMVQQIK